jgi:hypothetical protein
MGSTTTSVLDADDNAAPWSWLEGPMHVTAATIIAEGLGFPGGPQPLLRLPSTRGNAPSGGQDSNLQEDDQ